MSRIKGEDVVLINFTKTGEDEFGHAICNEKKTVIENVLIAPLSLEEQAEAFNLTGKKAVYQIAIPKKDEHVWKNQSVEFFGQRWIVVGFPKQGIECNIPLEWNQIWQVAKYE